MQSKDVNKKRTRCLIRMQLDNLLTLPHWDSYRDYRKVRNRFHSNFIILTDFDCFKRLLKQTSKRRDFLDLPQPQLQPPSKDTIQRVADINVSFN